MVEMDVAFQEETVTRSCFKVSMITSHVTVLGE